MRIRKAGRIEKGLWLSGTEESCVYLLEGEKSFAVINAGLSHALPDFLRQIAAWGIPESKIQHLVILHAHFDHVGMVPYLKRKWPHLAVYASVRGWEALANPKAVSIINDYMLKVCRRVTGSTEALSALDWQWRDDVQGEVLGQDSIIDLGGRTLEIHETPGHSSCSISVYNPELKALFPSDAAAIPYGEEYVIAAGSSFEIYLNSLDKLAGFDVDLLCADHYGYVSGPEAATYIVKSKEATLQMIDRLQKALQEEQSLERAAAKLVKLHFQKRPDYFVHPDILTGTYTNMLRQFEPHR